TYHHEPLTGARIFWGIICRMPRPWLALLAVVLAAAGCTGQSTASSSASASTDKPAAAAPPRPVKVFQAVEERVPRMVTSTGALAADDTVVLGVKVPGRLVEQAVDLGTRVRKGQMIARIDQMDYKLRVEQAEAALQQARARLGLPLAGSDEQVDPEKTSIVRQARAVLDEARLSRERSTKLLEQNLIARAQDDTVYHGRVVRLSPIVQEQNRTLLIEAEVPNQNAVLKPGAFARAEIVTDGSQPVIRVPAAALVTFAGVEKLLVVRQGKIVEVRVQTGRRANDRIEIVAGLKPGESVVLQPGNLAPGQAVSAER